MAVRYNDEPLDLNEEELMEEHANLLETKLTQEIEYVEYSLKKCLWLPTFFNPNYIKLVQVRGVLFHRDSPEAQIQMQFGYVKGSEMSIIGGYSEDLEAKEEGEIEEEEEGEGLEEASVIDEVKPPVVEVPEVIVVEEEEVEEEVKEEEIGELEEREGRDDESDEEGKMKFVKLPNAFNYVENQTLTYTIYYKDDEMQTETQCLINFIEGFSQMTIFDTYEENFALQELEKQKAEREKKLFLKKGPEKREKTEDELQNPIKRELFAAEILERMLLSNINGELYIDYQYWEDPSDEFKESEGNLLPLFTFTIEQFKHHAVTFIDTSMQFKEVFAVAYGCFEHARLEKCPAGGFCLFTVGNSAYPMWCVPTYVGVMAISIHKQNTNIIACGLVNGAVHVYDYNRYFDREPTAKCENDHFHLGIVTQVVWADDNEYRNMNFFSCGTDGCVINWSITNHGLDKMLILSQKMNAVPVEGPFGVKIPLMCSFTCICFHPEKKKEYLIGDEFGAIYKCHVEYMYTCLLEYKAHDLVVTRIDYNKFLTTIFASSSNDYMVKIWEEGRMRSLIDLDLDCGVGDVQWAPYSATVLAACTDDGNVHVFDLDIDVHFPICKQPIVARRKFIKLTRIEFNTELPIMRIGDDRGTVHMVRISPNLRKKVKPNKKEPEMSNYEMELKKLNNLLFYVREPEEFVLPKDMFINRQTNQLNFIWE